MSNERMAYMDSAIQSIRGMYMQLVAKNDDTFWGNFKRAASGYQEIADLLGLGDLRDSSIESQKLISQAIGMLEGSVLSDKWGNLYTTALSDDDAFTAWEGLADQSGVTLAKALNTNWSLQSFGEGAFKRFKDNLPDPTKPSLNLALVAVIFVALAVIFVMK